MGQDLRKLDIIALTASGKAAEKLRLWLIALREDTVNALAGVTTIYHKTVLDNSTEKNADASDQDTANTLANSLKVLMNIHLPSTGNSGVHRAASAEAIAALDATDLGTAIILANELKADYNTHLSEAGVHIQNDTANAVGAADASDLPTLQALLNEIKADYNTHVVSSMAAGSIEE